MDEAIICSHRLQPLHLGHLHFWMEVRQKYQEHLIICILRRSEELENVRIGLGNPDTFEAFSRLAFAIERNPLPNWERLRLTSLAVASEPTLIQNTTILLRNRPDVSWEASIEDLPKARKWAFNVISEPSFSRAKVEYYRARGEEVIEMNFGRYGGYDGQDIRGLLRKGNRDFSFLPPACQQYFADNCLRYFLIGSE